MITDKEKQLIKKVLEGKTSKEIAKEMLLSVRWIEDMRGRVCARLNCRNFYEVLGVCFRNKWVDF